MIPRPTWENMKFIAFCTVPHWVLALTFGKPSLIGNLIMLAYLKTPCWDENFGHGRKFHWVRQLVLFAGFIVAEMLALR